MFRVIKKYFVTFKLAKELRFLCSSTLTTFIVTLCFLTAAGAQVIKLNESDLSGKHYKYLYQWYNPSTKPKAIVIAIHGLALHGLVYDNLASHLADKGLLVLAPDLPGYGRYWRTLDAKDNTNENKEDTKQISYTKAQQDLVDIIKAAKSTYKDLPLICVGESMGADLALSAAQSEPSLVNGIVLASPALKTRLNITPRSVMDRLNLIASVIDSNASVNLAPYIEAYVSEDPNITHAVLTDPLVRTQLSYRDIWHSHQLMRSIYKNARLINQSMPVLVMQGSEDKVLESKAIINLVSNLNSNDQTVKWFKDRGHLILEACQPKNDVLETLDSWLNSHIPGLESTVETNTSVSITSLPPVTPAIPALNTN